MRYLLPVDDSTTWNTQFWHVDTSGLNDWWYLKTCRPKTSRRFVDGSHVKISIYEKANTIFTNVFSFYFVPWSGKEKIKIWEWRLWMFFLKKKRKILEKDLFINSFKNSLFWYIYIFLEYECKFETNFLNVFKNNFIKYYFRIVI